VGTAAREAKEGGRPSLKFKTALDGDASSDFLSRRVEYSRCLFEAEALEKKAASLRSRAAVLELSLRKAGLL
jgi:hypothetical protein